MKRRFRIDFVLTLLLTLVLYDPMFAQSWNFVKEKDSVQLYTRLEVGKSIKSYKAVARIHAPALQVYALLEDVNCTDWWEKGLTQIKILLYEKDKLAEYYLVYDLPWPITDRDLCVKVLSSINWNTGLGKIAATPIVGVVAESKDKVRIKDYRQTWTVKPAGKNLTTVELEGFVDPAGNIPDWIVNMIIYDIPMNSVETVQKSVSKNMMT
jgi:hypothetical protein